MDSKNRIKNTRCCEIESVQLVHTLNGERDQYTAKLIVWVSSEYETLEVLLKTHLLEGKYIQPEELWEKIVEERVSPDTYWVRASSTLLNSPGDSIAERIILEHFRNVWNALQHSRTFRSLQEQTLSGRFNNSLEHS